MKKKKLTYKNVVKYLQELKQATNVTKITFDEIGLDRRVETRVLEYSENALDALLRQVKE